MRIVQIGRSVRLLWLAFVISQIGGAVATAQPRLALTPASLSQAVVVGESQSPQGLPVLAARIDRMVRTGSPDALAQMTKEYEHAPYDIYLLSPFVRAASTVAETKRRFLPSPIL